MKTIIVTGASGNLGQAVVQKFLAKGVAVIGTILHHDTITIDNPKLEKVIVDLTDEENSRQFVENVVAKHGSVDAAVLTIGGFAMGTIAETKTADIMKQYKLNFETAYNMVRPVFLQMMKQKSGRIFLIGSRPGLSTKNAKGMVSYSLAKSLIFRLAELINDEAKGHDIVASVIVPSTIDTPQNRKAMPDADFNKWVKAEEIADTIYYYASNEARSIREPVIKVYGNS